MGEDNWDELALAAILIVFGIIVLILFLVYRVNLR